MVEDFFHTVMEPSVLVEAVQVPPEQTSISQTCAAGEIDLIENKRYQLIPRWPFLSASEIQNLLFTTKALHFTRPKN